MKKGDISEPIIAEGIYQMKVSGLSFRKEKQMMLWHYKVDFGKDKGAMVTDVAMLRDTSDLWKIKKILDVFEMPDDIDIGEPLDQDAEFCGNMKQLIGTSFQASIGIRTGKDGVTRNFIIDYSTLGVDSVPEEVKEEPVKEPSKKAKETIKKVVKEFQGTVSSGTGGDMPDWAKDIVEGE